AVRAAGPKPEAPARDTTSVPSLALRAWVPVPAATRRRPWGIVAGLGAVVLAALAVAAFLVHRPTGRVAPEPRPPEAPPAAVLPAGGELPPPARHDFGLKVAMLGTQPGPDGALRLVAGQEVRFRVEV